jgi:hypothetical protein
MSDYIVSQIRTYVPLGMAVLFGWLASLGLPVGDSAQAAIVLAVGGAAAAAYYALVRKAEQKWPIVGKLLGSAKAPVYTITTLPPAPPAVASAPEGSVDDKS